MGVIILDGQAVNVKKQSDYCVEETEWFQPVMPNDCTSWQMQLTPKTDIEIFTNPNLNGAGLACPTGWSCSGATGTGYNEVVFGTGAMITQTVTLVNAKYYRLCVEIAEISAGMALVVTTDDGVIFLTSNTFTEEGTFCTYFYGDTTGPEFAISATGVDGFVYLTSVSLKEISIPNITVETCDGVEETVDIDLQVYKERALAKICWAELEYGCYKICVDPIEATSFDILGGANNIITEGGRGISTESGALITWIP